MRFDRRSVALALLATFVAGGARAHSYKQKALEIVHPWCFETAEGNAAVYMVIRPLTRRGDRLVAAATDIGKAELREVAAGTSRASAGLAVTGKELALKRGGPHILLTGLKKPLGAYDSFLMTLTFQYAGKIEVEVMLEEKSTAEPATH